MTDVVMPQMGESIVEGTLTKWLKKPGEAVAADEAIATLETDKVSVDVPSPVAGVLTEALANEGDTVAVGGLIARIDESATAGAAALSAAARSSAIEYSFSLRYKVLRSRPRWRLVSALLPPTARSTSRMCWRSSSLSETRSSGLRSSRAAAGPRTRSGRSSTVMWSYRAEAAAATMQCSRSRTLPGQW